VFTESEEIANGKDLGQFLAIKAVLSHHVPNQAKRLAKVAAKPMPLAGARNRAEVSKRTILVPLHPPICAVMFECRSSVDEERRTDRATRSAFFLEFNLFFLLLDTHYPG
jgi:hypothetical protein